MADYKGNFEGVKKPPIMIVDANSINGTPQIAASLSAKVITHLVEEREEPLLKPVSM